MGKNAAQEINHNDNRKDQPAGIRIRTLSYIIVCASFFLYILLICITLQTSRRYDRMLSDADADFNCEKYVAQMEKNFNYLTDQAQLYAMTLDLEYVSNYFSKISATGQRAHALEKLQEYPLTDDTSELLQTMVQQASELTAREIYAMRLTAYAQDHDITEFPQLRDLELLPEDMDTESGPLLERAREMVFGLDYQEAENRIENDIASFLEAAIKELQIKQQDSISALKSSLIRQRILIGILFVGTILLFAAISRLIIRPLQVCIHNIRDGKRLKVSGAYEFRCLALTYNQIYDVTAANIVMLRNRAEHDPLTGIANRGAFDQCRKLLQDKSAPLALLIIDVDKFKAINDRYGHETGDRVLKKIAKLLEYSFRDSDLPARIGGDEFAVVLMDITANMKPVIEEKINNINHTLMHPTDGLPEISLSVGAAFSERGFPEHLYRNADSALYRVKGHGCCNYCFYEEDKNTMEP